MIAATIIAKNPEKFGFKNVPYLPPVKYERVQVDEPTSLKAAASAVNVPLEEVQALNPELMRGVTPPEGTYTLNLPPNSKEFFSKNITLARAEHPAIAARPVRTAAKSSGRSYHSRSHSTHQASAATRHGGKTKTYAKSSKKSARHTYASKGKTNHSAPSKSGAKVYQASLLGPPSLATKNKSKTRNQAARSENGSGETRLAKKMDNSPRSSGKSRAARKNGSAEKKSKGKVSKAKSRNMFAEAR
jgi:hypothetical protein